MRHRKISGDYADILAALTEYERNNAADNSKTLEIACRVLRRAIAGELNDIQRDVVVKYYYGNMTQDEIAKEYGYNRSTISRYLSRSRQKLERILKYYI